LQKLAFMVYMGLLVSRANIKLFCIKVKANAMLAPSLYLDFAKLNCG